MGSAVEAHGVFSVYYHRAAKGCVPAATVLLHRKNAGGLRPRHPCSQRFF
jgi:hypothetical protein